jgi:predicted MPP superfamily phosphohydrolase
MRLLLLQLSDIHVRSNTDWILTRARRVADAVRDLDHEVDICLIALTGDIAFSGLPEQYEAAARWVADVKREVHEALLGRVQVQVVAIPGNHDLDLRQPSPARGTIIESMLKDPLVASDPGAALVCLGPQKAFWDFFERVAGT